MKSLRWFAFLMLAPYSAYAAEPAESLPPLFYVLGVSSEVTNIDAMGLSPGAAGDANRKSILLHPIACMGGECRRIVDPPVAYDNDWLAKLLAQEPTQAGLLAYMLVSFDGYYYDVVADFQEAKLNASGRPVYGPRTFVQYAGVCPRPQRAEDTARLSSERPTTGVLGSYDLQSRFLAWSGCTNERLLQQLDRSFERIAGFWRARLTPESAGEIAAKLGNWEKLPLVNDVLKDAPACKSQYGEYRVVRDLGEYFWLAFPDKKLQGLDNILMVPRCGLP